MGVSQRNKTQGGGQMLEEKGFGTSGWGKQVLGRYKRREYMVKMGCLGMQVIKVVSLPDSETPL